MSIGLTKTDNSAEESAVGNNLRRVNTIHTNDKKYFFEFLFTTWINFPYKLHLAFYESFYSYA